MLTGRIHSYESFGAVDGPGIRFVVFFQGCPLRCCYCHNPDTWDFSGGTEVSSDELVEKILIYKPFFKKGGGVTLSGGEPLAQHEFALELINKLKQSGIHTAIDTSGAVPLSECHQAVDAADMILLDIKSADPELCEKISGSRECFDREREMLEYCEKTGKIVWIRHVAVPGLTINDEMLTRLYNWLSGFFCIERIEPLPFHKLGEHKWIPELYTLKDTQPPTEEEMKRVNKILRL